MDIRSIRNEKGFTLRKVSKDAGISESYLSMIENRERTPSIRVAMKLSEILGFEWTRFYEEEPAPKDRGGQE